MATIPAAPSAVDTFEASSWLAEWAENGGIVFFVAYDQLCLRCAPFLDRRAAVRLDSLRDEMLQTGAGHLIAATLARRRGGDVP